jgi:hypothetical protein
VLSPHHQLTKYPKHKKAQEPGYYAELDILPSDF